MNNSNKLHFPIIYPAVLALNTEKERVKFNYKHARILAMCARKGHSYSLKYLMVSVGLKSKQQMLTILNQLEAKGLMSVKDGKHFTDVDAYRKLWAVQRETHGYTHSIEIPSNVADSLELTDKAKLIFADLLSLAKHNDKEQPSINLTNEQLAARYRCHVSSIKLWLKQLHDCGFIERIADLFSDRIIKFIVAKPVVVEQDIVIEEQAVITEEQIATVEFVPQHEFGHYPNDDIVPLDIYEQELIDLAIPG